MAAEPCTGGQRALEVHQVAGRHFAERGAPQRLRRKVRRKVRGVELHHGKAAPVHRNAVAQFQLAHNFRGVGKAHSQPTAVLGTRKRFNLPGVFGDASKHRENILPRGSPRRIAAPTAATVSVRSRTSPLANAPAARPLRRAPAVRRTKPSCRPGHTQWPHRSPPPPLPATDSKLAAAPTRLLPPANPLGRHSLPHALLPHRRVPKSPVSLCLTCLWQRQARRFSHSAPVATRAAGAAANPRSREAMAFCAANRSDR